MLGRQFTSQKGRPAGSRGETARQLIRWAKYASRRKFPAEQKIRSVIEGNTRRGVDGGSVPP
jgi:hypothetical protein